MTKNQLFLIIISCISVCSSCVRSKISVELIVKHAKVYTLDKDNTVCEAFAVKDGKIVAIGSEKEITKKYRATTVEDAGGRCVLPGFYDSHCHFTGYAQSLQYIDLRGSRSIKEVIERLKKHQKEHPSAWLCGRGWDQNLWKDKNFPNRKDLDSVFGSIPIVLTRIDGHAVLVNSKAMQLAGINENTKFPAGEAIIEEGKLSGMFREGMAEKFRLLVPKPVEDEMCELIELAQANCFAAGLTSVVDAGIENQDVDRIVSLQQKGYLKLRIDAWLHPTKENIKTFVLTGVIKTPYLHIHSIKLYADGALGSRGAWLLKPYSDEPQTTGISTIDTVELERICSIALRHGYQVCTHAIGDAANRMVLNVYGKMLGGPNDRRWRIEHAQVIDSADVSLFGKYNIIPSVQATHATSDMDWAGLRLGNRIKNAYLYKRLLDQNGWLPNGTDFPIEEIYPIYTLYAAVARKAKDGHPVGGFQMRDALTRIEALRSMTIWAAQASFEEKEKGTLEKGKYADFVIWNTNLMSCQDSEILSAKPVKTYSGGQLVFEAK